MYFTIRYEEETTEALKARYAKYYEESFVSKKDVGYIIYQHDAGMEVELSDKQVNDFINDVNIIIDEARVEKKDNLKWWGC